MVPARTAVFGRAQLSLGNAPLRLIDEFSICINKTFVRAHDVSSRSFTRPSRKRLDHVKVQSAITSDSKQLGIRVCRRAKSGVSSRVFWKRDKLFAELVFVHMGEKIISPSTLRATHESGLSESS